MKVFVFLKNYRGKECIFKWSFQEITLSTFLNKMCQKKKSVIKHVNASEICEWKIIITCLKSTNNINY